MSDDENEDQFEFISTQTDAQIRLQCFSNAQMVNMSLNVRDSFHSVLRDAKELYSWVMNGAIVSEAEDDPTPIVSEKTH